MKLTREEFMNQLKQRIGDDRSDETLKFLEDMTDTYDELEKQNSGNKKTDEEWEKELKAKDDEWRKKYTDRFFSTGNEGSTNKDDMLLPPVEEPSPEEVIKIDDLFE